MQFSSNLGARLEVPTFWQVGERRVMLGVKLLNDPNAEGPKVVDFSIEDLPAEQAGLKLGDVVVQIAGENIDKIATLQAHRLGETIKVVVVRGDKRMTFNAILN